MGSRTHTHTDNVRSVGYSGDGSLEADTFFTDLRVQAFLVGPTPSPSKPHPPL